MPQLDPAVFTPQLVWLAITFVVLYLAMARGALPRISEVLEARQNKIAHDLDEATTLRNDAEAVLAEYEAAMAKARSDGQAMLARAAEESAGRAAERHTELGERIAGQLAEAEASIARAKAGALAGIDAMAGDIARAAAEKLIGATVDEAEVKAALATAKSGSRG